MKTVTEIKKTKSTVQVTLDGTMIEVQPELVIKYHLAAGVMLDEDTYHRFFNENSYLSCLRMCLHKLKKMMTVNEMKEMLQASPYPIGVQKQVLSHLIQKKYLDDLTYAKIYLELKKYHEGPEMISYKLKQKGISDYLIEQLFQYPYDEFQIVFDVATTKCQKTKNKTQKQLFQTIKMQLMAKGYHQDIIDSVLAKLKPSITIDEQELIKAIYRKLYLSYSKKYKGYELEKKLTEKLYQRGFSYDIIKGFIKNK